MDLKFPKGVFVENLKLTLVQQKDSCDTGEEDHLLEVTFENAGGGHFYTLKSDRWAMDADDQSLFKSLETICKMLDDEDERSYDENPPGE